MKIVVGGYARHGKDTFCELLGLPYITSSRMALDLVIWPALQHRPHSYRNKEECFADRVNRRRAWYIGIRQYNTPDPTRLGREILSQYDVYCGIRSREEFKALKEGGLFDLSIWVDAGFRLPSEDVNSCDIVSSDFDIVVANSGELWQLADKVSAIKKAFGINTDKPIKDVIVEWADEVFPDRTIANAIQKMVLQEIPEYLMAQDDAMELADIGILLYDIAHLAGVDLDTAIRTKMGVNRKRKWKIDESTGLLGHIK